MTERGQPLLCPRNVGLLKRRGRCPTAVSTWLTTENVRVQLSSWYRASSGSRGCCGSRVIIVILSYLSVPREITLRARHDEGASEQYQYPCFLPLHGHCCKPHELAYSVYCSSNRGVFNAWGKIVYIPAIDSPSSVSQSTMFVWKRGEYLNPSFSRAFLRRPCK